MANVGFLTWDQSPRVESGQQGCVEGGFCELIVIIVEASLGQGKRTYLARG